MSSIAGIRGPARVCGYPPALWSSRRLGFFGSIKIRKQVKLYFEWIAQHLRSGAFVGVTENAAKRQSRIAVCTNALVAVVRTRLELKASMRGVLQTLGLFCSNRLR